MSGGKIVKSRFFVEDDLTETLAEVSTDKQTFWKPEDSLNVVGKPVSRVDGYDKVSGTALYTFDLNLPRMTWAATLRCPHPHAEIVAIDTGAAEELPGVLAILTHRNTPKIPWFDNTSSLFDPHLRYAGDEVACVAAESESIAKEAIKHIKVEYKILPFTVEYLEAHKESAPKIHKNGNLQGGKPNFYKRGDPKKGFEEADVVVEDTFSTSVVVHNPLEVHCSVANWDGDRLTVWDSTQNIFGVRDTLANSLKIPASKVRVIKKYMGGGFGSKLATGKYSVMAALLAKKIGRPVKITLDRIEMNLAVGNRPASFQKLKVGVKKDGTLTAMKHLSYGPTGAYPDGAGCSWPLRTIYKCDNVRTEDYSVYINAGQARPMRAPGHVQGTFGLASIIDEAAEKIGMDPLELRMKNYVDKDQVFNAPYTSKHLMKAYKKGAEVIGWNRRNKVPGKPNDAGSGPTHLKRGIGMASQIWWGGGGPPAYATIKLNRDGSVRVLAGTQDIGTGTYTHISMVASETLEIPMEKITVILGDTGTCPFCPLSGGSLTSPSVSPAVRDAAEKMKAKLMSAAAAILELPEDQLIYREGTVKSKSDAAKTVNIPQIIGKLREQVLVVTGMRNANPKGYALNTFGAQFAEVEVDTETGKIRVIKVVAAHDVGRILNPKTAENQFHGGIIQGVGFALMEERFMDRQTGKVLNTNLHDYKMPTIKDVPEIEVHIVSDPDPLISSVGAKGIGEPAHIPTGAAIANAVYNAIGVRIKSLPITPDKVLNALHHQSDR
jgi:CO/xanthine dehydrogenase Mo-binding subunit